MTDVIDEPDLGSEHLELPKRRALPKTPLAKALSSLRLGLSLAVVFGVGIWGYQLLEQDAAGVPVIAATSGPTRIAPEDPGGAVAGNLGLSVNQVLSQSGGEAASEIVVLAPQVVPFAEGDLLLQSDAEAGEVYRENFSENSVGEALAAMTQSVSAFDLMQDAKAVALADGEATSETVTELITVSSSVPGVAVAVRPPSRPAALAPMVAAAPSAPAAVERRQVAAGTPLVQLGAFPSAAVAESEWQRLSRAMPSRFEGKGLVIEMTLNAGREFHRLRASGFEDIADARRFCTLMEADGIGCIPTTAN